MPRLMMPRIMMPRIMTPRTFDRVTAVRGVRCALRATSALIFLAIVGMAGAGVFLGALADSTVLRVRNVVSGSMTPAINVDDLVVYRPVSGSKLRPGDVIGLKRSGYPIEVTHRVVSVEATPGAFTVVTKGDANPSVDQAPAVFAEGKVIWRAWFILPGWGTTLTRLSGGNGLPFALGLIPLLFGLPWIERQLPNRVPVAGRSAGGGRHRPDAVRRRMSDRDDG